MASIKLFSSYDELKQDRVDRILIKEEKKRQENATQSLKNLKH